MTSCTRTDPAASADTLHLQLSGEPVTLDPSLVEDGLGLRVTVNVMDGLMGFDNSGVLQRRIARDVQLSEDRKTYTFSIRPDAVWSDGVKVTADQIRFALERALSPKTGSKLSGFLREIVGADEVVAGKTSKLSGVSAEGDRLKIRLKRPISYFAEVFALPLTYPLREDVLKRTGGKWDPLRDRSIPSTGPYRIAEYQRDQQIVLAATRDLPEGAPKTVVLRMIQDETTGARLFDQGKIDILTRIPSYEQKKYEESGRVRVVPFHATYFLSFNLKETPFDDVQFRRAVAGSIRRTELVKALETGEIVATDWIPPGLVGHVQGSLDASGRDPRFKDSVTQVKARKLSKPVQLGLDSSGRNILIMERVQADLKEALAWNAELKTTDWKTHIREIYSDPPSIYRFGWLSPIRDPILFLSPFQTSDPFSFTGYSNPAYDRLVNEIRGLSPGKKRTELIRDAQKILVETDAVIVPLYHYVSTYAVGPRIERYETNPYGSTRFDETRLKK